MPAVKLDSFAAAGKHATASKAEIIDIRSEHADIDLKKEIESKINPADGPKSLPTLLLYDEKGLQLFEDITYLDEYYLTNNEIDILTRAAADIASHIPDGAIVVELGSGNLRKVGLLLQAFEDAAKNVDYYALDLSHEELIRSLAELPAFKHVTHRGLLGTYDDGRDWLKDAQKRDDGRPRCIIHMGSSIGNFSREEAAGFLRQFSDVMRPQDMMLVGVDSCMRPDKVHRAYNDSQGITHKFILNGLTNANTIFNRDVFNLADWKVIGEYVYDNDDQGGRHQAFVTPLRDVEILGKLVRQGERVQIEKSLKYSGSALQNLWMLAGMEEVTKWTFKDEHGLHLLRKSPTPFPQTSPGAYAPSPLPSLDDWTSLWHAWHIVTRQMLPDEELGEKPIRLRNACIFYLGHIPNFLDIQLNKTVGTPPTEPASFQAIFERGIDPDVDDPSKCHQHSEVPDEWPALPDILAYQDRVRARLRGVYERGQQTASREVARAIWLAFEHELMHIETLLYMMVQSDRTLPPPDVPRPDFEKMAKEASARAVENKWFDVPAQKITIGIDDPEDGTDSSVHFGWDNEKPSREEQVHQFQAKGRPITNGEYGKYMLASNITTIPAAWSSSSSPNPSSLSNGTNGNTNDALPSSFLDGKFVRTVFGLVPLRFALDWPVMGSYDELAGCAAWMGGRIPTFEEARSIYAYVDDMKTKDIMKSKLANKVPAVNGHLVNNGVEETPPFIDLAATTTAFHYWHPTPVTPHGGRLAGQSDFGGAWEWTSSALTPGEGFSPMPMYPGYTADFFDGLHNIVLGGSWATHPRIAGRKSFVNWFQRKYQYAWTGARLVRDTV